MKKSTMFISIGIAVAIAVVMLPRGHLSSMTDIGKNISLPEFTADQIKGQALFNANCEGCHGTYATGSKIGPTLIHKIYEPSHHGDGAFFRAVKNGSRQHHWQLGNMPPIADISELDVALIIKYVRAIQQANGIK